MTNPFVEDGIIAHLKAKITPSDQVIGIGDDCAVLFKSENNLLITTDALVENYHFKRHWTTAKKLGQKALSVNISDIASMGGVPLYALLSLSIPSDIESSWMIQFVDSFIESCGINNVNLIGGNITGEDHSLHIHVTLIGKSYKNRVLYRGNAKPGDILCVTGNLGDSAGGLKCLESNLDPNSIFKEEIEALVSTHCSPIPHLKEGQWLGQQEEVHTMMDVSDGLGKDISKLIELQSCGVRIDIENIPVSKNLQKVCYLNSWNAIEIAINGGEDYCLVLSVSDYEKLAKNFEKEFGKPLYKIGYVHTENCDITYMKDNVIQNIKFNNFNHFKKRKK